MDLYFLRHGDAGKADEWKGDDSERPLSPAGIEAMSAAAEAIAAFHLDLDMILTSPYRRAQQTAEIVASALKPALATTVDDRLAPGFTHHELSHILRENAELKALMLVGHEPDFSTSIAACIGGGRVECGKGALARVQLRDAKSMHGSLVWLVPARVLGLRATSFGPGSTQRSPS
jgi:phosphohistidine phosphatase